MRTLGVLNLLELFAVCLFSFIVCKSFSDSFISGWMSMVIYSAYFDLRFGGN